MSYKQIPETTFGETPAAMYLCRLLNKYQNSVVLRTAGRKITGTFSQVKQLVEAYEFATIDPKTLANCLRLMREEIASEFVGTIESQLIRNVRIGYIKRALRLATVARKAERVMSSPDNKSYESKAILDEQGVMVEYYFKDSEAGFKYKAGSIYHTNGNESEDFMKVHRPTQEKVDYITPELLHERSLHRCIRLKKPHVTANN